MMDTQKLTQDDIHNWSKPYVQNRWSGKLTTAQRELIRAAEIRHHEQGTSALQEAKALNAALFNVKA